MPTSAERPAGTDGGTVYGARHAPRSWLPPDRTMRVAVAVAAAGVLVGVLFATGLLGGAGGGPVTPAGLGSAPATGQLDGPGPTATAEPETSAPVEPTAAPTTPPAGPTVFRAPASGLCLGVAADDDPEGAPGALAGCTGGPEQQWVAAAAGNDFVTLTNAASGRCLDVNEASTEDGARVQQWSCNGQANQQWRVAPLGDGRMLLAAGHSGKCAQLRDAGSVPGTELEQATCAGTAQQQWTTG